MKSDILNYTIMELEAEFLKLKIPKFRAKQVFSGLHKSFKNDLSIIPGIPKELIHNLNEIFYVPKMIVRKQSISENDGTIKFLFKTDDKNYENVNIETVLILENERRTICVSTQAGCNAGCEFCATGKMGLIRNLSAGEIISQIYAVIKTCNIIPTNIVFMGMGEPFLNYNNLLKSLLILTDKSGLSLSSSRITISTIGIKGKIKSFADEIISDANKNISNVKLALSLHSTDNGFRRQIIPLSKKNSLKNIYAELQYFYRKTKNKITYEYIYFHKINDSVNDIKRIIKLSGMLPCNFNIINFHPITGNLISPLKELCEKIQREQKSGIKKSLLKIDLNNFIETLRKNKVVVNLRKSSGVDINAACGQLAVKNLTDE